MRIALTNPTNWPYVRRGVERFLNELAEYLAAKGHDVTLISAHAGAGVSRRMPGGFTTRFYRRLWHPALARLGLLEFHPFLITTLWALVTNRYDVVMSCTFTDAWAACLSRLLSGTPNVFWVNGLPPRVKYIRSLSLKGVVFGAAVKQSNSVVAFSRYMEDYLVRRWRRHCDCIPVPIQTQVFRSGDHSRAASTVVCAGALDDARKGGRPLMCAFNVLKQTHPGAILQLAYPLQPERRQELIALVEDRWRSDVHFLNTTSEELPAVLAGATISVLPSVWEPYGMIILESMACGTPVVGARDGGVPELIEDGVVGALFDPGDTSFEATNIEGLAEALRRALALSALPETAARCRQHAERYSYSAVGPRFEELFHALTGPASPQRIVRS